MPAVFSTGYGAHQGKHLGFFSAHHVKTSPLDPAPAPAQHGLPVQNDEIFIVSMSLGVLTFALSGNPTRIKSF